MELRAVKHLDPVVGVDMHAVIVAPSPTPVFVPHPHIGFILDLREYITAAMAVIGSIVMTIVEEKVVDYLQDHPDVMKDLGDAAQWAGKQLDDAESNAWVAQAMAFGSEAANIGGELANVFGDMANATGAGVGMGGGGRPIFVNGFMRATAGTHTYHVPGLHFPLGESFAPIPSEEPVPPEPSNDAESYMGSKTVLANNDPMSFMALPAMSCWSIGLEPPQHNGVHTQRTYPSMPSSFMLPIPVGRPVFVGGPPIMNMAAAAVGLFKAFRGSAWAKKLADKLHLKPGFLRCNVLGADPVNMITGEVVVQQRDFLISGRLPLVWSRHYASHDAWHGAVGALWQTPADIRLELMRHENALGVAAYFPDRATAFDTIPDALGWPGRVYDARYGDALYRQDDRLVLRTVAGFEYHFELPGCRLQIPEPRTAGLVSTLPIVQLSDLHGNAWVFERGRLGGLTRIVERKGGDATGRAVECNTTIGDRRRNDAPLLTELTLTETGSRPHRLASYQHDDHGNLICVSDAMGSSRRFEYAQDHRMVRHTSARGVSFHYSHRQHEDGVWRVVHTWGDAGVLDYRFDYDIDHRVTRITDSLGHATILQANERGHPVARIDPLGGVTSYQYDASGRANAEIGPAGNTMAWVYDAYGNLLEQTLPDGTALRVQYNAQHKPVSVTEPGGGRWRYEWDERGNMTAQCLPSQAPVRYEYDRYGQAIARIDPKGATTRFEYDHRGHLARSIDSQGRLTQYLCDTHGNLLQLIDPLGQVSRYEYDRNGNLTRAVGPGGRETHCAYDGDGNLLRHTDAAGNLTQLAYSALGHVTERRASDGNVIAYRYDTEERLVGVVNERGERYEIKRDANGRVIEEIDFWGQARRYIYDRFGQIDRRIDALGQEIVYETDTLGRIVKKHVEDAAHADGVRTEHFSYDACGRLLSAVNPNGRVDLRYDEAGRLVEERQDDDFSIIHRYDDDGRRIERCAQLRMGGAVIAHTVRYGYDVLGEVDSIQTDDATPIRLARDELGRVCSEDLGGSLKRELSYAPAGQLVRQALIADTGCLFSTEYAYDASGELRGKRDSRLGVDRFDYDRAGKLAAHIDSTGKLHRFLHDPAGDRLRTRVLSSPGEGGAWRQDPAGQWLREGELEGCSYTFDRAGNLLRKWNAQQDLYMRWDGDGLLVETLSVRAPSASTVGALRINTRYMYDAFHRRTRKITLVQREGDSSPGAAGWLPVGERTTRFLWEGDTLIGEIGYGDESALRALTASSEHRRSGDGNGLDEADSSATQRRAGVTMWTYYPGTYRPLACTHAIYAPRAPELVKDSQQQTTMPLPVLSLVSEARNVFHTDPNGMPTRLTTLSGEIIWESPCCAWGGVSTTEGRANVQQPLRFQGQYCDLESGLHYNRFRYYDPAISQFISPDPIGLLGGVNPYAYGPNGWAWSDPLGLSGIHIREHDRYFGYPDDPDIERRLRAAVKDYLMKHTGLQNSGGSNLAAVLLHDGTFDVLHGGDLAGHAEYLLLQRHKGAAKILWSEQEPCNTGYKMRAAKNEARNMLPVEPCKTIIEQHEPFNGNDRGLKEVIYFFRDGRPKSGGSSNTTVRQSFRKDIVRKNPRLGDTTLPEFLWGRRS